MKELSLNKGTGTFLYGYMILLVSFIVALVCIEQFSKYNNSSNTQMMADSIADGTAIYMSNNNVGYEEAYEKACEIAEIAKEYSNVEIEEILLDKDKLENDKLVYITLKNKYYKTSNVANLYGVYENQSDSYCISRNAATSFYSIVGTVTSPRLEGTETELTMDEVRNNPWYSTASPFQGQYSLLVNGGNCTAYAWARRCELESVRTGLPTGDAGGWYNAAILNNIYKCGQIPKVGAVCCWSYFFPGNTSGHVAVIEMINEDGSIIISQSAYGTSGSPILFYNGYYNSEEELENDYGYFNGYIYLEKVE